MSSWSEKERDHRLPKIWVAPVSIPMIRVLQLIPDSLFTGIGSITAAPATEWVSRSKAVVASRIVRAVILLHPHFRHSSVRHHVQIFFLGIEKKLGTVTGAIIGAMGCQWDVRVVFEPRLLRLNQNFVKVATACPEEGECEVFVRNCRRDRGYRFPYPECHGWFCCYRKFSFKRAVYVKSTE